jgi:short-subunit dehydrogenase
VAGTGERFGSVPACLTAEEAAAEALRQLERGAVVRVPTAFYGFTTRVVGLVPRAIVRRLAGRVQRERA